jgi:hypothetical protein
MTDSIPSDEALQRHQERLTRYHALVDKSLLQELTPEEEREELELGKQIDAYYDWYYEPILKRLEEALELRQLEKEGY